MKKGFTLALLMTVVFTTVKAQTVRDTLTMGPNYSVQTWYKFETDKETKAAINNWDLAFITKKLDAGIWVNHAASLYKAVAPASAWATMTVDTTELLASRSTQVNTDSSWSVGALNRTQDGVFDYGWGKYSVVTHNVTGDSVYVIKAATDGKWRKFVIERLALDTSYFVKIADLNGANPATFEVKKGDYAGKNFGYYSFATAAQLDREPLSKDWDVTVWRHWGLTPDANGVFQSYLLTGFLQNFGTTVAKITKRDTSSDAFAGQTFKPQINVIGADWKTFNLAVNAWKLADSTAYFVKTANGRIYKMIFVGFGGAATGNAIFTREFITTTSVKVVGDKIAALAVSPNPATDGHFNIVYDFGKTPQQANFQLFNLAGQAVYTQKLQNTEGVQVLQMPTLNLKNGVYLARLTFDGQSLIRKVVIQQ
ncbi:MAG: T9SS type A sorting domain-containing protein [Saprospiraceae bacterium]|nr:T9SS type A sorting domain-containing protein [Saprospiraceae bacterium]